MNLHWIVGALMLVHQAHAYDPHSLTLTHEGQSVANVKRTEYLMPHTGWPFVNDLQMRKLMDRVANATYEPPVNAHLNDSGVIVSEMIGFELDRRMFASSFIGYMVEGGFDGGMEIPQRKIYPKVDGELLAIIKEKMIGQYTTYFNSNNKSRSHNISLSVKAVNNQFIFPGETFSFNQIVGIRSAQRGYKRAKVIVRGEVAEGIGGGICQTSSTLFNAADRAGLRIVQRYSHSRRVPYVPPGRDATVSWYGPDFVFQNTYEQPIMIRAFASGGQVTILIYTAESVNTEFRKVPSASKRLPEEVEVDRGVNGIVP